MSLICGQVSDGLRQRNSSLRQADKVKGILCGHSERQRSGIRVPDVLRGKNDHAPGNEQWVLAGFEHAH